MSAETESEKLFGAFCELHGIPCVRLSPAAGRTPDFAIELGDTEVICEIKQINPNPEDRRELAELQNDLAEGGTCPTVSGLS